MKSCDGDAKVLEACILNTVKHYRVSFILQFDCTAFTLTTYYLCFTLTTYYLCITSSTTTTITTTSIINNYNYCHCLFSLSPFIDSIFFFPVCFFDCVF